MRLENREEEHQRGVEEDIVGDGAGDVLLEKNTPWQRSNAPNRIVACKQPMLELATPKQGLRLTEGPMQR